LWENIITKGKSRHCCLVSFKSVLEIHVANLASLAGRDKQTNKVIFFSARRAARAAMGSLPPRSRPLSYN